MREPKEEQLTLRYPAPFTAADRASLQAQTRRKLLVGAQLLCLLAAALLSPWGEGGTALLAALAVAAAMLIRGALQMLRPERTWFDGRALAESLKTLAWRYAMVVPPFDDGRPDEKPEARFRRECQSLLGDQTHLASHLVSRDHHGDVITASIRDIRRLEVGERDEIYREQRLKDQEGWYSTSAINHDSAAMRWQLLVLACSSAALRRRYCEWPARSSSTPSASFRRSLEARSRGSICAGTRNLAAPTPLRRSRSPPS